MSPIIRCKMELAKVQFHFQLLDIMPFYLQAFRTLFYLELDLNDNTSSDK